MKKQKHLKTIEKRLLALFMSVCLIGTMIPIPVRAEDGDTVVALSENKVITDWEWVDDWKIIDPDSGNVLLPFASAENVAYFDNIVEMLPTAISAGGEELTLGEWGCEDYPVESGAYEGEYVFETTLPDGYTLSDDTNVLDLTVVLGNSDGYDAEVYAYEPIDTTLEPGSTLDVSKIPMGCLTPRRYFIREEGTYTITGYNSNDTTARFVIYASCTIILDNVNLEAGITYEDRTDVYYGSGKRGVFEISNPVNVDFVLQGSNRIVPQNYYGYSDKLNAILLDSANGQVTFSGTGSLDLEGRIAPVQRASTSSTPYKIVMKSGTVECFGIGNRNALVDPIEVVSADNSQFVYEGGNFYNGVDDNTSYFGVTKDNTTGDIYRVKIPVSSSTVQVKVGANGSFSTAKAISGNIYVWNSGKVTDYYVIDGSNYYHYRSTNSTGSKYLTDAVEVTDDASVSGAKGTVKVGGSTVSDAILTFTGEQFTGSCTTDSNGAYDKAIPQGTYQVSVKLSGSDVTYNMGTITLNQESKQTYDFGLTTLTGTVKDTSETPNLLSNARISVEYDGTSYTAVSGSDGVYTMVLPNGIASEGGTFSVTANHLMASSKTETVNYQAPNTICDFTLTAASSTEINVYTEDDLIMLSEFADQLSYKTINLMNDITLTGRFQGIERSDNHIEEMTFNGNGHTIENLTTPLFQRPRNSSILYRCTVTDLHLKGEINDNEHSYVGALATIFNGHKNYGIINGCSFEGSIKSTVKNACVGGLVGSSSDSVIKNSFVRLTEITANNAEYMGGIVGDAKAGIYNSYAIIKSFGGTMSEGKENNRGSIVGGNSEGGGMWINTCYAVVESKETSSVVHRMGLGGSNYQYNFSYGPSGVFGTDATDMSHATDLSLNLMTAAAGSGTEENAPLVDRLNAHASGYKTWYNGTDGYPCFTIPTYTITFSGGSKGTGSQEAKSVTLGESVTLPGAVYKNSDYVQKGWATSENSTTKAYELGVSISPTANMTLYPYWEEKQVATGYEVPTGLTAIYGDTLSNISLPDGFTWNAPETSVGDVGTRTFTATYTPTDETYRKNPNVQVSVEVKRAPAIYDTLVNKVTNLTYNRAAQQLVTAGTTSHGTIVYSLTGNSDYTSTIPTATNAGEYTVYYMIQGDANHKDSEVGNVTVSIGKANLEDAEITLGDSLTYNGEEQTQSIASVIVGTMTLAAGEYTVSGNTRSNAGTYTLTVTGNGNFEGSKQKNFTIARKATVLVPDIDKKYVYTAGSKDAVVSIDIASLLPADRGETTYLLAENTAVYVTDKAVGTDGMLTYKVGTSGTIGDSTTLTVTAESTNYEDITVNVNIYIVDKYIVAEKEDAKVDITGSNTLIYGQTLSTLTLNTSVAKFVEDGDATKEVTGTLAWANPDVVLPAGTTVATWKFTPDDSMASTYQELTGVVAITVNKATPDVTALPTVAARTYNPTVSLTNDDLTGGTVTGVDGNPLDGEWSWQSSGIIPTVNNSGYVAVFTPTDSTNYNTVTRTITVTVTKATPYIATAPTAAAITYGDTLSASALSSGIVQYSDSNTATVAGSFAWADSSMKPSVSDSNTTTYQVVFNPSDMVNYNTVETTVILTVSKAENAPNIPSATMNVANSCTKVSDVTLPTGWVWQDADKDTALTVGTAVTATAVYDGADKGNYVNETVSVTITRSECEHAHTEIREVVAASCTADGYTGDTYCTDCSVKIKTGTATPALGHNYTSKVTTEPTTDREGVRTYTCDRCGHSYTRAIEKLQDNNNNPTDNNPGENKPGENQPGEENTPDTGKPYIKDETGKEGWDVIKDEADKTKDGDTVVVEMNGSSVAPGDVLDEIKGKDVTIVFDMRGGITWSVNGESITGDKIGDIDFSVEVGTNTIPVDVIYNVSGERYSQQISLAYDGEFGFTAVLSINMGKKNSGLFANLFYYNEQTGELEFICAGEIAENGIAELTFTHASDYAIVIDKEPMDVASNETSDTNADADTSDSGEKDTQTGAEVRNDAWNPWWIIVIGIMAIVIGLGVFLVAKKKKEDELE